MVAHGRAPGRRCRCRCHCRCTLRVIGKEAGAFHSLDSKPPNCARPRCFLPRISGMKALAFRSRIPIWAAALSLCLLYKSTLTDALARLSFESNNRTSNISVYFSEKDTPLTYFAFSSRIPQDALHYCRRYCVCPLHFRGCATGSIRAGQLQRLHRLSQQHPRKTR